MKAFVLYQPKSEHARKVEELVRDFEKSQNKKIELIDCACKDGVFKTGVYDLVQTPSIVITRDDGELVRSWSGPNLPLMSEVAGYLAS